MKRSIEASSAPARRLGSYTTAKVTKGRVERLEAHARRLGRDAIRTGLPAPDRAMVLHALQETARESFGDGEGIIRLEWSRLPDTLPELQLLPRPFVAKPGPWRVATAKTLHPGPERRANTKQIGVEAYEAGRREAIDAELDEVLLFDANGYLVEGASTNILAVTATGSLVTPALELGPVEGLGLTLLREQGLTFGECHLTRAALGGLRELLCVNAVRGVVAVGRVDASPVGSGQPGPWSARLARAFSPSRWR